MLQVSETSPTRICRTCQRELPHSAFHKCPKHVEGIERHCKACRSAQSQAYQRENADKLLQKKYGVTEAAIEATYVSQGGRCAICREPGQGATRHGGLAIDHCHGTGQVRGLLCGKCNRGVGHFDDDPRLLREAARYIEKTTAAAMMVA